MSLLLAETVVTAMGLSFHDQDGRASGNKKPATGAGHDAVSVGPSLVFPDRVRDFALSRCREAAAAGWTGIARGIPGAAGGAVERSRKSAAGAGWWATALPGGVPLGL